MNRSRPLALLAVLVCLVALSVALGVLARHFDGSDLDAVRDVAQQRTATATAIAHAVSWLGRTTVLAVVAAVIVLVAGVRRHRPLDAGLLVVVAGAWVLQTVAKLLSNRPRPPVVHLEHVTSASFPSGHALQVAALAAALTVTFATGARRWLAWVAALAVVLAVAASRVYLGVHYPTDVIAGMLLGTAWGVIACAVLASTPAGTAPRPIQVNLRSPR